MRKGGGVKSLEGPSTGTGGGSHSEIYFPGGANFQDGDGQLSMFGRLECKPKDLGGRPRWDKSKEYQELVVNLLHGGAKIATIAQVVGVSQPTLRHYFSSLPAWQARRNNRSRPKGKATQDA